MPKTIAMRARSLPYNDKIQEQILRFLSNEIPHDFSKGVREINLDLTVREAQQIYTAKGDGKISQMAASGELQSLHQRCVDLVKAVEAGYIKVNDQLDRTAQQITEAEQEIYDELVSSEVEGLRRIDNRGA
jgi:hypothetical protein